MMRLLLLEVFTDPTFNVLYINAFPLPFHPSRASHICPSCQCQRPSRRGRWQSQARGTGAAAAAPRARRRTCTATESRRRCRAGPCLPWCPACRRPSRRRRTRRAKPMPSAKGGQREERERKVVSLFSKILPSVQFVYTKMNGRWRYCPLCAKNEAKCSSLVASPCFHLKAMGTATVTSRHRFVSNLKKQQVRK